MPIDRIKRITSTSKLRSATPNAVDFAYDETNKRMAFKDHSGNTRGINFDGGPEPVTTLSGDGAIAIQSGINKITKGSAAALTLAAPTAAQEGTRITVISNTAFAHVITATGLIDDGVTGGSKTTATFAAFAGASITLVAINLKWSVESKNVVTIT